jgi:hypothetical protein
MTGQDQPSCTSAVELGKTHELTSYQQDLITTAELAAEAHRTLALKIKKKKKTLLTDAVTFAERSYQEALYALQFFQQGDLLQAARSKNSATLYRRISQLSSRAAQAASQWYTLYLPFLYWQVSLFFSQISVSKKATQ